MTDLQQVLKVTTLIPELAPPRSTLGLLPIFFGLSLSLLRLWNGVIHRCLQLGRATC